MEKTPQEINAGIRAGEEWAYRMLYDAHYEILCRIAYDYVKDTYLAETIVGDTIFHIWERRENLDIQGPVRRYLVRAVRNRCLDVLASQYVRRTISEEDIKEIGGDTMEVLDSVEDISPLGILLERELEDKVVEAVEQLPKECRVVFEKSRFEGLSYQEIADSLGISVNTVKYHIKGAIARIYNHLERYLLLVAVGCMIF
ncbi:MAG: RNA polymerase sigma-70 factor [Tidjanibacter sp.]|nr:RNA polymerase sigma-70 factor [Tidjanibacter sp.]